MAADYNALRTIWLTLNAGTTGQKLDQLNAMNVTGAIPTSFFITGADLFNCLDWEEFEDLTQAQQTTLLQICAIPGPLKGGPSSFFAGMVPEFYAAHLNGPTMTALIALAKATVQPWWRANGFSGPIGTADLTLAGIVFS